MTMPLPDSLRTKIDEYRDATLLWASAGNVPSGAMVRARASLEAEIARYVAKFRPTRSAPSEPEGETPTLEKRLAEAEAWNEEHAAELADLRMWRVGAEASLTALRAVREAAERTCGAMNRDGYACELKPGHPGDLHRALIGRTDEQGPVPEVQWREKAVVPPIPPELDSDLRFLDWYLPDEVGAVQEAAERYVKAWDAKDAADCAEPPDIALVQQRGREKAQAFAALRAALASPRPASGETEPSHRSDRNDQAV